MISIKSLAKATTARLSSVISGRADFMPEADPRVSTLRQEPSTMSNLIPQWDAWIQGTRTPGDRVNEMKYYDFLEREIGDVRKALDAFATMACTGNLAGGGRASYTIKMVNKPDDYPPELRERFKQLEKLFRASAYITTRTATKYGSYIPEIMVGEKQDKKPGVTGLRAIPPGTMFRNINNQGQSDPEKYWTQIIDSRPVAGPEKSADGSYAKGIPQWKMPHFAMWSNVVTATETLLYGCSILQPFGAIGLKVQAAIDSILIARLSRAAMRYKYKIDVSDIVKDQAAIKNRVAVWQRMVNRGTALQNQATRSDGFQTAAVPDADFFIPSAKDLSYDVETIDGDMNLSRVGDVDLMIRFYFGALGVPPEYLGHERSQGGRSNLSQIDINFARSTRHIQMFTSAGFEHVAYVDMILGGFDPVRYPIECVPPPIGARDDLLQAQIRGLQAQVLASLRAAGMKLEINPRWVMQTFMAMDEELEGLEDGQLEELFEEMKLDNGTMPDPQDQKKVREILARNDDMLAQFRSDFKMLLGLHDEIAGGIHHHDQPTAEQLKFQMGVR